MPKPNSSYTVKELKDYVKSHKLNHPEVKMSMKKAELQAGLKKIGHWSSKTTTKAKKKVPKGSHKMPNGTVMKDSAMPKKRR